MKFNMFTVNLSKAEEKEHGNFHLKGPGLSCKITNCAEFLKFTGLTGKTGEYFQCPVYFGKLLVGRTSKINGQIRT
jgi:hypothetical protein